LKSRRTGNSEENLERNPLVIERAAGSDPETTPLAPPEAYANGKSRTSDIRFVGLNLHRTPTFEMVRIHESEVTDTHFVRIAVLRKVQSQKIQR